MMMKLSRFQTGLILWAVWLAGLPLTAAFEGTWWSSGSRAMTSTSLPFGSTTPCWTTPARSTCRQLHPHQAQDLADCAYDLMKAALAEEAARRASQPAAAGSGGSAAASGSSKSLLRALTASQAAHGGNHRGRPWHWCRRRWFARPDLRS